MSPARSPRGGPVRGGPVRGRSARGGSRLSLLAAVLLPLVVLTGCGIRPTSVPTDFGAAPSRVPCALRSAPEQATAQPADDVVVPLYLVCREQLVSVERAVRLPEPDGATESGTDRSTDADTDSGADTGAGAGRARVEVARALLDELQLPVTSGEKDAGLSSDVRTELSVDGPLPGDPAATLRLSSAPDALSDFALAQIICTYARSAATAADRDGTVLLAGPGRDDAPSRYTCTDELRAAPGTVDVPTDPVAR